MKVWAIFSIENDYNQPDNNLVVLYKNKPNFEQLFKRFSRQRELGELEEYEIVGIVGMLSGNTYDFCGAEYRLEEVEVKD